MFTTWKPKNRLIPVAELVSYEWRSFDFVHLRSLKAGLLFLLYTFRSIWLTIKLCLQPQMFGKWSCKHTETHLARVKYIPGVIFPSCSVFVFVYISSFSSLTLTLSPVLPLLVCSPCLSLSLYKPYVMEASCEKRGESWCGQPSLFSLWSLLGLCFSLFLSSSSSFYTWLPPPPLSTPLNPPWLLGSQLHPLRVIIRSPLMRSRRFLNSSLRLRTPQSDYLLPWSHHCRQRKANVETQISVTERKFKVLHLMLKLFLFVFDFLHTSAPSTPKQRFPHFLICAHLFPAFLCCPDPIADLKKKNLSNPPHPGPLSLHGGLVPQCPWIIITLQTDTDRPFQAAKYRPTKE